MSSIPPEVWYCDGALHQQCGSKEFTWLNLAAVNFLNLLPVVLVVLLLLPWCCGNVMQLWQQRQAKVQQQQKNETVFSV